MDEQFTVQHNGKPYLVALQRTDAAGERWTVTLGGTAITALDRHEGETRTDVQRRLQGWLDAHPGMDSRDDIHLGGG